MWIGQRLRSTALMLSLALLLLGPGTASADYQVTESQLTELEQVFQELRSKQEEQANLLSEQAGQLTELQRALNESRAQRGTLEFQLKKARESMNSSQTEMRNFQESLTEANESLQKSAKEAKATRKRIERQRNLWAVLAGVAVIYAAAK